MAHGLPLEGIPATRLASRPVRPRLRCPPRTFSLAGTALCYSLVRRTADGSVAMDSGKVTAITEALAAELQLTPERFTRTPLTIIEELRMQHEAESRGRAAELRALDELATRQRWTRGQRGGLENIKMQLIGTSRKYPRDIFDGDDQDAVCHYDCYRRATMLEPLASCIFRENVPGDFVEAGVYRGGITIFFAAMMMAKGEFGQRKIWVADSFAGLPPAGYAVRTSQNLSQQQIGKMVGRYTEGKLRATLERVQQNFESFLNVSVDDDRVRYVPGFFNDSLPGAPVKQLALLRADSDLYSSTYETLAALYPRLSIGGFVVFDDYKLAQARAAIVAFRREKGITSPVWGSARDLEPPFQTLDRMAFWRKSAITG